jgi:hypothetical protein
VHDTSDLENRQASDLTAEVDYLAEEMKLMAINLAIAVAKQQQRNDSLRAMEPQFGELIQRANAAAERVTDTIKVFRATRRMTSTLPASTDIIDQRGAYDSIEAKLLYVYRLSRQLLDDIGRLSRKKQVK